MSPKHRKHDIQLEHPDPYTEMEKLIAYPFVCANCDRIINSHDLFCSEECRQIAKYIRYYRRCIKDGRVDQLDVQQALRFRLAHILAGGYPERERRLTKDIRDAVIRRDEGRCRICGAPGTEIDHIHGSSHDLNNLQLLCKSCHSAKTASNLVPITPLSHPKEWALAEALHERAWSRLPQKLCDSTDWAQLWRKIASKRHLEIASRQR
ncbi:MAG: HNH endonuclease [Anaerolineae bacterium]|nr:HNH endonuclease [Anaerolineae bacterium]